MIDFLHSEYIPYEVLLFNTIVFHAMRIITNLIAPASIRLIFLEVIATLELCAGCAELGVIYEVEGYLGFGIGLLLICLWWCYIWDEAEACPCGPIEECLVGNGINVEVIKKLTGQAIGGAFAFTWIKYIWSFHMTEEHKLLHTAAECQASLQVNMILGACIEGFITLISRIVALETTEWSNSMTVTANAVVTTILVLAATSTTGGFFNPVLATALTLGCRGNTLVEHIVVYWIGSIIGGLSGRMMFEILKQKRKPKLD